MPVTVEVEGVGEVEFPDGMKPEEMQSALSKKFSQPKQASEQEVRAGAGMMGFPLPASGEERAARDAAVKLKMGIQERPSELSQAMMGTPATAINYAMQKAGEAATGIANIPSRLANIGKPEATQVPLLEANVPKFNIPQIEPEQMAGEGKATQVAAGVYNKLAEFGTGMTSPGAAFTMAGLPAKAARIAFGAQIGANIPGTISESASILRDPKATLMEKAGAAIAAPAEAWMLKTITKSAPVLPNAARAAAEANGIPLKGTTDALQRESPQVLQPVQKQPLKGQGQVPPAPPSVQAGQGIQPAAQGQVAPKAPVSLSPEHQELLNTEAKTIGRPVKIVSEDDLDPGNAPFAQSVRGKIATIDRGSGTILINPKELGDWLTQDVPRGKEGEAIRSILSEENIHLATRDEWAKAYHDSLTPLERSIGQRVYGGPNAKEPLNPTMLGHEMLRTRIQQLARMPIKEVVERAQAEREQGSQWKVKTLLTIGRAVQGIRETLGTKASKEGLAILDKVQGNLDAALNVAGASPGAQRKQFEKRELTKEEAIDLNTEIIHSSTDSSSAAEYRRLYPNPEAISAAHLRDDIRTDMQAFFDDHTTEFFEKLQDVDKGYGALQWGRDLPRHSIDVFADSLFNVLTEADRRTPAQERLVEFVAKRDPELVDLARRTVLPLTERREDFAVNQLRKLGFVDRTKYLLLNDWADFRQDVYEADPGLYKWINTFIHNSPNLGPIYTEGMTVYTPKGESPAAARKRSSKDERARIESQIEAGEAILKRFEKPTAEQAIADSLSEQVHEGGAIPVKGTEPTPISSEGLKRLRAKVSQLRESQGEEPAAARKRRETSAQDIMYLPPVAQVPERATATELGARPFSAVNLEAEAARHLSESARPSFDAFAAETKGKYGNAIQPGQLRELWTQKVWERLTNASGQELGRLRDQLGLGREVGTHEIADSREVSGPERRQLELSGATEVSPALQRAVERKGPPKPTDDRVLAQQRYRANVMGRIGEKLIGEAQAGRKAWRRQSVEPSEVAAWREPSEGALRPISADDVKNPESLGRLLTEGGGSDRKTLSRKVRGGKEVEVRMKAPPESVTKRLTAFVSKALPHKVELVSTYRSGKGVRAVDPVRLGGERPNAPLETILKRYTPIYSFLLDEPVQNYHKSYESVRDFEDRFVNEARSRIEQASQMAEAPTGEETAEARPTLRTGDALTDAEAGAVLDHLYDEVSTIDSPEDMRYGLEALTTAASEGRLTGRDRQVISALDKATQSTKKRFPPLTENQAIDQTLDELYEIAQNAPDRETFVQRTLARFGTETAKAVQGEPGLSTEPTGKELTIPIERRPPTDVRPENVPQGTIPEKIPAPPVPEGSLIGATSELPEPPASMRKVAAEGKDRFLAEVERVKTALANVVTRSSMKDAIPAALDASENLAAVDARDAGVRVGMASGWKGAFRRGADDALASIHTVLATHGIVTDFDLKTAGPKARARFGEILRNDSRVRKGASALKLRQAFSDAFQTLVNEKLVRADNARYKFVDAARDGIDNDLIPQVQRAITKQETLLKSGKASVRAEARKMLKYLPKLLKSAEWARDNWTDKNLRDGALQFKKELDRSYQEQVDSGKPLRYDIEYAPGRYDDEFFSEGYILFPARRTLGLSYGLKKTFPNYFEAAEQGYQATTLNARNLVEHSVRQGQRSINYGRWLDTLKAVVDPVSGLPIAKDPVPNPGGGMKAPSDDYQLVPLQNGKKTLAVHAGYADLIKALTSESKIQEFPPARIALEMAQRLKHTLLVGDLFHLARLSYYAQAIAGVKRLAGYHSGLAALEFAEADLPQAVKQGLVSQKAADWALTQIDVKQGSRTFKMTRSAIGRQMIQRGLNVGRIQDALYLDLVRGVPGIGPALHKYNKWLFDSYTRGLMMESAVHEFERLNAKHPNVDSDALYRDVARDMNRFFGSIGRQGWFKSRTWQDMTRLAFLAPQWVEGLVMKEAALPKRLVGTGARAVGLPGGRTGLPAMGSLASGIGGGLVAMMALTQAINLIWRHKPTWQNEEPEHKWDAWLPGGKNGFWLSPLSLFNELTHDVVRLFQSKPKAWDALQQIGQNKLSPFGHMGLILATDKSPRGEYQTTTGGVMKEAGKALLPVPISFGTVGRGAASAIAPGLVSPPQPGTMQRQLLQWGGLKAEPAQGAGQRINRMAQDFTKAAGKGATGFVFQPTDDPSYAKLRSALRNGDTNTASQVIAQLEKSRPMQKIGQAMKEWAHKPFTGSKKLESRFINSLSPKDLELYSEAMQEKQREYEKFLTFLSRR